VDYVYWNVAFQKYVRLEPGFQSGSIDYLDADRMALCLLLTKSCYPGGGGLGKYVSGTKAPLGSF
jgi:hypothetical protein